LIFATLGTDEHPFTRLVEELERLVREGRIRERVVVQRGFTPYQGELLETYEILPFDRLVNYIREARVVITHGGPGSIALSLLQGKVPVVVPRDPALGEHVDGHQIEFVRFLKERGSIIPVFRIEELGDVLEGYKEREVKYSLQERIDRFLARFEELLAELKD